MIFSKIMRAWVSHEPAGEQTHTQPSGHEGFQQKVILRSEWLAAAVLTRRELSTRSC